MDSSLSPSIVQEVAECEELDPEWRFVAKMRLENGNKLLKGSGKRLIGAENAYVPDSGARTLTTILQFAAFIAVLAVILELLRHFGVVTL